MNARVVASNCPGPNRACKAAFRKGLRVHVRPDYSLQEPALVMPGYHYETSADGVEAIMHAAEAAPLVHTDEDLYRYRAAGLPYFLPVGWVDPSRRG